MKRPVSGRSRRLATELQRLFAQDAELAEQLNDAHRRLLNANDQPWSRLHPDGLRVRHADHPAFEASQLETTRRGRSQALACPDVLGAIQAVHWQIHRAHCDHQQVAEYRRRLAAATGEVMGAFVDELIAAGWSEEEARTASVHELSGSPGRRGLGHDDSKLASGITSRPGAAGQDASNEQDMESTP
jgi:hypothetical protein